MINIKCFLLRLYLLAYSPIFPVIVTWIIFMSYRIYFEPVMLCDDNGWTLFQLKSEITAEVGNYRTAVVKCEQYNDLKAQLEAFKRSEASYSNPDTEKIISDNLKNWEANKWRYLGKVRHLESSIRKIEPNFQSPVNTFNYYPRVGKGY